MSDLSWPAARLLGRAKIPGTVELTGTHVRFRPDGLASQMSGAPFSVQLRHVAAAGIVDAPGGLLRRVRTRLCITLTDGSEHIFDVPAPDDVAGAVRAALTGGAA